MSSNSKMGKRHVDIGQHRSMTTRVTSILSRPIDLKCPRCGTIHIINSLSTTQQIMSNIFNSLMHNDPTRCGTATCVECGFMMAITLELVATAALPEKLKLVQHEANDEQ